MNKRRAIEIGAVLLLVAAVMVGGKMLTTHVPAEQKSAKVLGLVITATEDSWKDDLIVSIRSAAHERGMEIMPIEAERSQSSQTEAVRALIVYRADAIIFSPVIETGWDNVLEEAAAAGIPVIAVDKAIRPSREGIAVSYVGYDYYSGAKGAAQYFLEHMHQVDGTLVELYGTVGSYPAKEIARGLRETLSQNQEARISYSVSGDYMRSRGREVIEGLLQNRYAVGTIISHNDAMTLGAVDALEQANKIPGQDVWIICFGGGPEVQALYTQGKINCLVNFDQKHIGSRVLDAAEVLLDGREEQVTSLEQGRILMQEAGE